MSADLGDWLEQVDPVDLLPDRRRDEAYRIVRPLRLVAETWFDADHGYALVSDARGLDYGVPLAVGRDGRLRRATASDGTAEALLARLSRRGAGTAAADPLEADLFTDDVRTPPGERAFDVDQTNDLVVVGERAVVKWDLAPASGEQAGPIRLRQLARTGFVGSPRTWALVRLASVSGPIHIATVSEFVADASDGWAWAVEAVRAVAHGEPAEADAAVADVARLVADLHLALSAAERGQATARDVAGWVTNASDLVTQAGLAPDVDERVRRAIEPLGVAEGTGTIPIHGDLHVGQILRAGTPPRYVVTDFDGNPVDAAADRLALQPAARDVASMLASWDHVGRVVLHRTSDLDAGGRARVHAWIERSRRAFLDEYRDRIGTAGTGLLDEHLVVPFQVLQECREYVYARRFLPQWHYVPDAALPAVLDRAEGGTP